MFRRKNNSAPQWLITIILFVIFALLATTTTPKAFHEFILKKHNCLPESIQYNSQTRIGVTYYEVTWMEYVPKKVYKADFNSPSGGQSITEFGKPIKHYELYTGVFGHFFNI